MELIRNLPNFIETRLHTDDYLNEIIKKHELYSAKIYEYDLKNRRFLCKLDEYKNIGYIDFNDYSIYNINDSFSEIGKVIYVYIESYDEELKKYKLTRKNLLEEQTKLAVFPEEVEAIVTSFYNDELAFCEFGAGLLGNISLAKYLHIKQAVYSLADLLQVGSVLKVKIDTEYKKNYFALTTYKVEDYYIPFKTGDIIEGTVLARLEDDDKYRYSYWFMVTIRIIGIIKSDRPLGYGQKIKAKVHSENENFIKFRFDSYAN